MKDTPLNLGVFLAGLALPMIFVVVEERSAAARMAELEDAASEVPIASAAEDEYCTVQLKQVVRRVAGACGLLESGARGCKPADAKSVATMSGEDFNALFRPLAQRAHIIQFDSEQVALDEPALLEVEESWAEKRGASFFFVVARASTDGDAAFNTELSQARAQAVLTHLEQKFPGDDDLQKIGLLWLGEEFAQLDDGFCTWNRSRAEAECTTKDINRSAFVAWIDCAI